MVSNDVLFHLLQHLSCRLVWIAPVGNKPEQQWLGYMVCKRSVNNVDANNTRVEYLRTDTSAKQRWKKPFRQNEHMFATYSDAIMAAAEIEGILPRETKLRICYINVTSAEFSTMAEITDTTREPNQRVSAHELMRICAYLGLRFNDMRYATWQVRVVPEVTERLTV